MFKKIIYIIISIVLLQLISFNAVFAENNEKIPVMSEKEQKNELLLIQIKKNLQNARNDYFQVTRNISMAKERLLEVTETITTLKEQLENMDYLISNTEAKIKNVQKQIAQKENMISILKEEIEIKQIELENQKILLKEYLKLLYLQENNFYDKTDEQEISAAKLLLSDDSIGETFQEIQYFTILEQTGQNIFNKISDLKDALEAHKNQLKETKTKLARLKTQLDNEKRNLQIQRNAKLKLLNKTKGEEEIYRQLIAASKQEQLALVSEINALKENLAFIEQKIAEEGENFNPDNYKDLINPNIRAIYDFELSGEYEIGEKLNWPVKPIKGISAYFHDANYKATFGIPHNAIDIPTPQGSAIKAPAAGVVYKVKNNGDESYSYIIIAHKGGILTVYGHVSEVLVKEREVVLPGEIIALSGGTPGTKGAGYLTTGPHLHFEVIKNGKHIDPLLVLPLKELDEEFIPSYLKETTDKEIEKDIENSAL
jgi:murein DD-endopeptidase MepM/ murein hydrolase activator NlpD